MIVVGCFVIVVVWQVGIFILLGKGIDFYFMLVLFLIFVIGVSYGVQLINEFVVEFFCVNMKLEVVKLMFCVFYVLVLFVLVSDVIGFMIFWIIEIYVIQDLVIFVGLGVCVLILINLLMIFVFLFYVGVSLVVICFMSKKESFDSVIWCIIVKCVSLKVVVVFVVIVIIGGVVGMYISKDLKIGDLDVGVLELWFDLRYNLDDKYVNDNYLVSVDVLVVMVEIFVYVCIDLKVMCKMDCFMWYMENVFGV